MITEAGFDCLGFGTIIVLGTSAMSIDIVNLVETQTGFLHSTAYGTHQSSSSWRGFSHMVSVSSTRVTDHLSEDSRSACFGEFQVFEDKCGCCFTHHEAITGNIEGTTRPLRIIIAA